MDSARLKALHAVLRASYDALIRIREAGLPDGVGTDTAFAIGEATGVLSKAKGLLGRDIDDVRRSSSGASQDGQR
jgi:hypothetical protein